jgi:hypothetical protein
MTTNEIIVCEEEKALAKDQVKAFFEACVPSHRKMYFMPTAQKLCVEQLAEIEQLKQVINSTPKCVPSYSVACKRYAYVSKEVIRKVSFSLARKVLP